MEIIDMLHEKKIERLICKTMKKVEAAVNNNFEIENIPVKLRDNREFALKAYGKNPYILNKLDQKLFQDKKFILDCIGVNRSFILTYYISDELKKDTEFMKECIKLDPGNFLGLNKTLTKDKLFLIGLLKDSIKSTRVCYDSMSEADYMAYKICTCADKSLLDSEDFMCEIISITKKIILLEYASDRLRKSEDFAVHLYQKFPNGFNPYMWNKFFSAIDKEIFIERIIKNEDSRCSQFIKDMIMESDTLYELYKEKFVTGEQIINPRKNDIQNIADSLQHNAWYNPNTKHMPKECILIDEKGAAVVLYGNIIEQFNESFTTDYDAYFAEDYHLFFNDKYMQSREIKHLHSSKQRSDLVDINAFMEEHFSGMVKTYYCDLKYAGKLYEKDMKYIEKEKYILSDSIVESACGVQFRNQSRKH